MITKVLSGILNKISNKIYSFLQSDKDEHAMCGLINLEMQLRAACRNKSKTEMDRFERDLQKFAEVLEEEHISNLRLRSVFDTNRTVFSELFIDFMVNFYFGKNHLYDYFDSFNPKKIKKA